MQCRFTTYKEYFCTLILPKNEERHFCSGLLAVLCVTANVLWLHFWLLFSTVQYFPNLHFSSRMAEEAPYEQGILFICTRAALWDPRNMNGLPRMPEKCWTGSPTCRTIPVIILAPLVQLNEEATSDWQPPNLSQDTPAKSLGGEGFLVFSKKPWESQIQQPCSSQPAKGCSLPPDVTTSGVCGDHHLWARQLLGLQKALALLPHQSCCFVTNI